MALNGPAEIVEDKYSRSVALADTASREVEELQGVFSDSIYAPPVIDVKWQTLAAPMLPDVPDLPDLPDISMDDPGGMPGSFTDTLTDVAISDFDESPPALDFGSVPTLTIGSAPLLPHMNEVTIPDAPSISLPTAPDFLQLTAHNFGGVDLHESWLDKLDEIPELTLAAPAPFNYSPGARYASQLLDNVKATLNARIHGGTGLTPQVEQAIWDRARDRETQLALAREQEAMRSAESLGFPLPSGVLIGQLADARREYHDKLSGLSRDVSIKQAEMEQENVKNSIQAAIQLETTLLDNCYKLEMLAFEASKTAAEQAIAAYNAALEHYKTLLVGYQAYASAYDTIIKAELSKIEVFKAQLSAEQTKADINKSLVERYRTEIEAVMSNVEIYKARVGAAQTLVEIEKTRIEAGGEQIKAFVATVGAQTAQVELYKTRVEAEGIKQTAYGSRVQAYAVKTNAQAEKARAEVSKFQARLSAKGLEWDGWKAKLQASVSRADIVARKSSIMVDGYRAGAAAVEAKSASTMRRWEADVKQYDAGMNLTFQVQKANNDAIVHANDARIEAAKIGLASKVQQLSSAWGMVSAGAQISGLDTTTRQLASS